MPQNIDRAIGLVEYVAISGSGALSPVREGYRCRMLCYTTLSTADGTVQFTSDDDGGNGSNRALTGAMAVPGNGGISTTLNSLGHFQSNKNETIWITAAGGATAAGHATLEWIKTH